MNVIKRLAIYKSKDKELLTIIECYSKEFYEMMLKQANKIRGCYVKEIKK